jgi:hypothetical protein
LYVAENLSCSFCLCSAIRYTPVAMRNDSITMRLQAVARVLVGATIAVALAAPSSVAAQSAANTLLKPADLENLFPATVFYDGQSAPAQLRNSGGVKFADGHYVLASLVDTSGYSTGVAAKYQGYLIAEVPLVINGKRLAAGAYGFGFLGGDVFLVTDLGGNDVLTVHSTKDAAMARPRPLEVTDDPAGGYRLYAGRSCVHFGR